jgi:hypothetical protein
MSAQNSPTEPRKGSGALRYIALTSLVGLITTVIGLVAGYGFNEITRDQKVLEVLSTSTGNLAAIPVSVAGNLQIMLPLGNARTEVIKSLFRFAVKITNKTEQGVDNVDVYLQAPSGIELVATPEISTIPDTLAPSGHVVTDDMISNAPGLHLIINLINPSETVEIAYLGYSRENVHIGTAGLKATVVKKDWRQKDVAEILPDAKLAAPEFANPIVIVTLMSGMVLAFAILALIIGLARGD